MSKAKAGYEPVIRAIDAGFGLVKFSRRDPENPNGVVYDYFHALAIPSDPTSLREIAVTSRNTVNVPTDVLGTKASFEVGYDILRAQTGNDFGRQMATDYTRSAIYQALMKGALTYMNEEVIDLLSLGLPVTQFIQPKQREDLAKAWTTGPEGIDLGSGRRVVIKRVEVRPQPLGSYLDLFNHLGELNALIASTNAALPQIPHVKDLIALNILVVDPGEHTLDWLLMQGGDINEKASGAADDSGRHRVVRAVMEALQPDVGRPLGSALFPEVNKALREGRPVKLAGKLYDLSRYAGTVAAAVSDPINRLIEGMRGMFESVDLIAVAGGHPELYADELRRRYPELPVMILPDSMLANVKGFQVLGHKSFAEANGIQAA